LFDPARYRIRIVGTLDEQCSDYCVDMTIEHENDPKRAALTILMGRLADQSALIGVLTALHDIGSRIRVVSYGPFRGLRGTILLVDTITSDLEEPFCLYLIALEGAHMKEPVWFEYDEVEPISELLSHHYSTGSINNS